MSALIFDFDGLIIDTERVMAETLIEAFSGFGLTVTFSDFGHLFGSAWRRVTVSLRSASTWPA